MKTGAVLTPGSFGWLAFHEIRLAWRARPRKGVRRAIGIALAVGWIGFGLFMAFLLRDETIPVTATMRIGALAASIVGFSFMAAQAMIGSQRTLYERGDLALLFSAPIEERTVLLAKLLGIAGTVALTYSLLLLPIVIPVAVVGHPRLFGIIALLVGLALAAASTGLALTLLIASIAGPRAARTVGQITAALLGGAVFVGSQLLSHSERRSSSMVTVFERLKASGYGLDGITGLPGRAAFGDPLAILLLLGIGIALFVAAGATMQHMFLSGYQDGGVKLSRARPSGKASNRAFHAGLFRSVFAKEWRLLVRDPALAFQIVLRLIYMVPIVFVAFGQGDDLPIAPGLAAGSVLIASQLVGSFAWLTVSAEDSPDLLAVAPVAKGEIDLVKLLTAFAMAVPFALVLPIAIAVQTPLGALITLAFTVMGSGISGFIELKLGKPGRRNAFSKSRSGSAIAGILSILIAMLFGGAAGLAVYFVG